MREINEFITNQTGLSVNIQHKILISLLIVILLSVIRLVILRIVWRQTRTVKIRYQWRRNLSFIIPFTGIVLISAVWIHAFEEFGTFLGLFTAGIAIALKDPLTNLAGWFFILVRKPFTVGDRIQVGPHTGDVIDIRSFQFTILEIGNWVDADQSTGRIIHLPNGKVFLEPQANFSTGFEYIWNETKVVVTFESNWEKAKSFLEKIIQDYSKDVHLKAKKEIHEASKNYLIYYKHLTPIVYIKVIDFGVCLTIRYLCNPRQRRGSENIIWQEILKAFNKEADIQFAYPTTRFYKASEEMETPPSNH
ncbi:mechanosensitive ion channel family protein [Draconibacterium halophilum]|uniref:Mechanosensitive ion channel family protein n=1 Tax=Draconibacterium halophilum TaxID=2706887 RepID=A0A6C0REG9_9BACT|nr:mechanosensitive ion channel family protein [Draconibacterium halophilum]QIA08780.1 mechanosensitive ion channel family protein [Draconibacterium halophilum]